MLPKFESTIWTHLSTGFSVFLTFVFVIVGFTIPRSNSLVEVLQNLKRIVGL